LTHREISHLDKELIELENDLTINDKELTRRKKHIAWRRQKVFTLLVQGVTNSYELASVLHISQSTASRDCRYLREKATRELQTHFRGRLPFEYKICSQGLQEVLRYAWSLILQDNSRANKIATLSLIAQCYKDRLDIAINASIITEALQQVEKMKQEILGTDTTKVQSDNRSISQ
jgi:hypothetical protein